MKRKLTILCACLLLSLQAVASDGSGWKMVGQLAEQIRILNEQMTYVKDQLDIAKQLSDREEVQFFRNVSTLGKDVYDLGSNLGKSRRLVDEFTSDPLGTKRMEEDIESMKRDIENNCVDEQNPEDCMKQRGRALERAGTVNWLRGKASKQIKEGVKGADAQGSIADSLLSQTILMAIAHQDMLDQREIDRKTGEVHQAEGKAITSGLRARAKYYENRR